MTAFGDAFKKARDAGKEVFTFRGKKYHTKTKEDLVPDLKKVPTPKARPDQWEGMRKKTSKKYEDSPVNYDLPEKVKPSTERTSSARKPPKAEVSPSTERTSSARKPPKAEVSPSTERTSSARKPPKAEVSPSTERTSSARKPPKAEVSPSTERTSSARKPPKTRSLPEKGPVPANRYEGKKTMASNRTGTTERYKDSQKSESKMYPTKKGWEKATAKEAKAVQRLKDKFFNSPKGSGGSGF